jgi:hypothetical protein
MPRLRHLLTAGTTIALLASAPTTAAATTGPALRDGLQSPVVGTTVAVRPRTAYRISYTLTGVQRLASGTGRPRVFYVFARTSRLRLDFAGTTRPDDLRVDSCLVVRCPSKVATGG